MSLFSKPGQAKLYLKAKFYKLGYKTLRLKSLDFGKFGNGWSNLNSIIHKQHIVSQNRSYNTSLQCGTNVITHKTAGNIDLLFYSYVPQPENKMAIWVRLTRLSQVKSGYVNLSKIKAFWVSLDEKNVRKSWLCLGEFIRLSKLGKGRVRGRLELVK